MMSQDSFQGLHKVDSNDPPQVLCLDRTVCLWRIHQQCRRPGFNPWVGKIPWRSKWQLTPILLPGKFHGWRSLVGSGPWSHKVEQSPWSRTRLNSFTGSTSRYIIQKIVSTDSNRHLNTSVHRSTIHS